MDKQSEKGIKFKRGLSFSAIKAGLKEQVRKKSCERWELTRDLGLFSLGFLLSRCHLLFGVRPIGMAFICTMPRGVWPTLFGAIIGYLSLGYTGIIFAVGTAVAILLRVAIGYSDKSGLFGEALSIRISISILSAFTVSVFEVLRGGLTEGGILFGLSMVVISPLLTFVFSGLFTQEISLGALFSGEGDLLVLSKGQRQENYRIVFFHTSLLMLLFFIGLSLRGVDILGVSLSYVFSATVTLLTAKRFGALRGLAVGFASSLGLSGVLSVSFALAGLVSGALFYIGTGYALIGGGIALAAFSAYSSGLIGLLSTLPEYMISTALVIPLLKKVSKVKNDEPCRSAEDLAEDMVGTMALSYQSNYRGCQSRIEKALLRLSSIIKSYRMRENRSCDGIRSQGISSAEEYEMVARLLKGAEEKDLEEISVDKDATPLLNGIMTENSLVGRARVFGRRKKRVILACEDQSGSRISSRALRQDIEKALGISLSAPEYYRKDKMALMECQSKRRLRASMATVSSAGHIGEVSGDTAVCFETDGDYYYALISDGMGSGDIAKETSLFVCDFLSAALNVGSSTETVVHMLNHTLRSRAEECSATVDLLEIDLIRGEGRFIKSGAAPSYVKRGSSIFRVKSQTAPLGLLSSVDAEKIKLEVKAGDYIIMLSDGVADETDDAAWLLLLLGETPKKSLTDYARLILEEAKRNSPGQDDRTVAVIRIDEA